MSCKHIFVTGGVVSSLGKGLTAASIGLLLKRRGYRIRMQKLDPYLNVDPGTMSPYQHGEVYVTEDGRETDLDLGHYERFTGIACDQHSNYTTGRIYSNVIARERAGGYLGKTVQVIPHVTDEIKRAIHEIEDDQTDIAITEIGGTAGDIESQPYLEAIRQYHHEQGPGNSLFIHLTLVPYIRAAGEMKTKPSQQSVGILRSIGIVPELLICRCERPFAAEHRAKLALFCGVRPEHVIEECDVANSIYEVPLDLMKQHVDEKILKLLELPVRELDMAEWNAMLDRLIRPPNGEVEIAVVGKYISLRDSYKSIYEALTHGAIAAGVKLNIRMLESEEIEQDGAAAKLAGVRGILVPGGFGGRGVEGKIEAIRFAREKGIPFFGICLGMQCAVIEFARNVCGLAEANSTEFAPGTPHPVISLLDEQRGVTDMGGTMRLGAYPCSLKADTKSAAAYGREQIQERHRHRYEFNLAYRAALEQGGLAVAGVSPDGKLVEVVELAGHPWFVACQYHPEFKSSPVAPHPLFASFVKAAADKR
ncbi:MAG TPA: CTP synthase [Kiritimatiellia bacterium]|nr:CTP synthase [Kiritimatiellia bacterium]